MANILALLCCLATCVQISFGQDVIVGALESMVYSREGETATVCVMSTVVGESDIGPDLGPVTISFIPIVLSDTTAQGSDYTIEPEPVLLDITMIGDTACKNISIQEDLETEGLETFTVSLLSGDESLFVEITIGIVTVVIIDNETPYSMIVSFTSLDLTVTEGVAMEPTDVCLQSEVSGDVHPLEPDIPFELVFEENTATVVMDYIPSTNRVVMLSAVTSTSAQCGVRFVIQDNGEYEEDESFRVHIVPDVTQASPEVVSGLNTSDDLTVLIQDNDGFVTIQIREAGNFSVEEIDEDEDTICVESFVTGRVLLLDGQVLDIFINIGGTATGGADYTTLSEVFSRSLSLEGDELCVRVAINDDMTLEREEAIHFTFDHGDTNGLPVIVVIASEGSVGSETIIIINDNEDATFRFQEQSYYFSESDGIVQVCTEMVDVPFEGVEYSIEVSFAAMEIMNAEMGRDYIFNETIQSTFSPCDRFDGDISCDIAECIDIELLDDMDVEGLQQFEIMITSVSLGTVSMTSSSTVIFLEDTIDGALSMDVDPEVPEDAGDHEDGDYEICVTLETQGRVEISFDIVIGINDGTAVFPSDFSATSLTLSYPDLCDTIRINNDHVLEGSEVFTLSIASTNIMEEPVDILTLPSIEIVRILDDEDATLEIQLTPSGGHEGSSVSVCLELITENVNRLNFTLTAEINLFQEPEDNTAEIEDYSIDSNTFTFTASDITGTIIMCNMILVEEDDFIEETEVLGIEISNLSDDGVGYVVFGNSKTLSLFDTSKGYSAARFEIDMLTVNEEETSVMICVSLSPSLLEATVIVGLQAQSDSATDTDFHMAMPSVTFELGDTNGMECSQVSILQDGIYENDEFVVVSCLPCDGNSVCTTCDDITTITIQDGNSLSVTFENDLYSEGEEAGSVEVCAVLQGSTEVSVTVTIVVNEDTQLPNNRRASAGSDFENGQESIVFGPSISRICRSISLNGDQLSEDVEVFQVYMIPVSPRVSTEDIAHVSIVDTDIADISFVQTMYSGSEEAGTVEVCAISSAELARTINIGIEAGTAGSAQNGVDYQLSEELLQFSIGNQRVCINIQLLSDLVVEGEEIFTVLLSSGEEERITLTLDFAEISITDNNDVNIRFQESSYIVSENSAAVTVCAVMDGVPAGGLARDLTVLLTNIDGQSAENNVDFIFDGSVHPIFSAASNIMNGDSACIEIPVEDDSDVEDDQQFQLEIVDALPGNIASPSITTVTITDNADGSVLLPEELMFPETDGTVSICASLQTNGVLQAELIVTLSVEEGGTATLSDDFILNSPFVYSIGSGPESCPSITIQDDTLLEGDQTFSVAVSSTSLNSNSIEISVPRVMITILDDEDGDITLLPIASVNEGEVVQVCVLLSCSSCQGTDSEFNLQALSTITSGTAFIGEDLMTDGSLTIAISREDFGSAKCVGVITNVDVIVEGNEMFTISLVSTNLSSDAVRIVTPSIQSAIIQDSSRITATFMNPMQSVVENELSAQVCIELSHINLQRDVTVIVTTQTDTATGGLDFSSLIQHMVVFGLNTTGVECFEVLIEDDDRLEDSEIFHISIVTTPRDPALDVSLSVLSVTIEDDDSATVLFTADSYTVSEEELTLDVCVLLDGSTEVLISITLSLQHDVQVPDNMRATLGTDVDFLVEPSLALTSANSQDSLCQSVTLINDDVFEEREIFLVSMSTSTEHVEVDSPVQITIIDDDGSEIGFEHTMYSTAEDSLDLQICVLSSDNLGSMITVNVALVSGSAQSGVDFAPVPSSTELRFSSESQRLCVDITPVNDDSVESDELFTAVLSTNQERVTFTASLAVITILDDEDFFVGFEQLSYTVPEIVGVASVCAEITGAPAGGFENTPTLSLRSMNGSNADNQNDFVFDPTTQLSFTTGSFSSCVDIEILDDDNIEGDHQFEVLITNATLGTILITSSVTTITIIDNADGALSLPTELEVPENDDNGLLEICTSLSSNGVLETTLVVTLTTVDNSAEIGEDYSLSFPFVITYSAGGPSEACTDITIVNDASLEGHHNFSVEITSTTLSPNAVQIPSLPLLIQIQDDDRATVRLLPIADVIEGQSAEVCVIVESLSSQTIGFDMTLTLTLSDGSAINGGDFTSDTTRHLMFPSGTEIGSQKCFSVMTNVDAVVEGDQDFMVSLLDVNGYPSDIVHITSPSVLRVTIQDNIELTATFDNRTISVVENEESVEACISLSQSTLERNIVITVETQPDTASDINDFTSVTQDVVFNENTVNGRECFSIFIVDNDNLEDSENFQVTLLRNDTTITFAESVLTVTIIDDDSASVIFIADYIVEEQEGMAEVCAILSGAINIDITVVLSAQENDQLPLNTRAITGSDFNAIMEPELVFTSTSSLEPICRTVTLVNNNVSEGTEFFLIEMSTSIERVELDNAAQVTILDDDNAVIGFEQIVYNTGESVQFLTICVMSTSELERTVSINIAIINGSAENEMDYVQQIFEPLTFTATVVRNCVDTEIVDDSTVEIDEVFSAALSTTQERVTLNPGRAEIIITDNDFVTVSFEGDDMIQFVSEDLSSKQVCVLLSHTEVQREITVTVATEEGTASEVTDFDPIIAQDLIFAGDTTRQMCFDITIMNDEILENTEVFRVLILPTNDLALNFENTVLNIGIENDDSVVVNFEETGYSVDEEQSLEVCVVLLGGIEVNITIILSAEEQGTLPENRRANRGSDFGMFLESELVFTPDNAQAVLCRQVPLINDDLAEDTELFLIDLSSTSENVQSGSPIQVTIFDQDSASVGLEMSAYTVEEGSGAAEVCVLSSPELDRAVMVEVTTEDNSANSGTDYNSVTETLTVSLASQRECVNIPLINDNTVENDKIFSVVLSTTDERLVLGRNRAEVIIRNDDTVIVNILQSTIQATESRGSALVCVFLGTIVQRVLNFIITPNADSDAIGGEDFSLEQINIIVSPPDGSQCSEVTIVNDAVREGEETFSVTISSSDDAVRLGSSTAIVTIQDDDVVGIQFANDFYEVDEGNPLLEVCIILTGEISTSISVTLTSTTLTATPGDDFSAFNENLIIGPNQQSQLCTEIATILDDDILESNETFSLSLTTLQLGVNSDSSEVTVTIIDNEDVMLGFVEQQASYSETDSITVCATLNRATERTVIATITAQDDSATIGDDYSINGELEFQPSTNPMVCSSGVLLVPDTLLEATETFFLLLESSDPSVILNPTLSELTVLIRDNNTVQVGFQFQIYLGMESIGVMTVCAVLSAEIARSVEVELTAIHGSANDQDYILPQTTLLFPSGSTADSEQCQQITIINDGVREDASEEFSITLRTQDPDIILQPNTAQILIIDNDAIAIEFDQSNYQIVEGESISVCVVLVGETDQPVEVTLTSVQNTALETTDYGRVSANLMFSGSTQMEELCHTVSTVDDILVENMELFIISLTTSDPLVTIPIRSVVALIEDNDEVALQFTQESFELSENDFAGLVCVEIVSGYFIVRDIPFTIQSTMSPSTTSEVEDFVAISENKQFEIQKQTEPICIIVYPNDDMTLEEDESFFVTIIANPPVSTSLSRLMASVIIRDDDNVTIAFEEMSYSVLEGREIDVCLILTGTTDIDVSANLQVGDITTASETEYTIQTLQLSFNASTDSRVCTTISVIDDFILEDDEQLSIFLNTNVIHSSQPAIVTIIDNDEASVEFSASAFTSIEESEVANVCVTLLDSIERSVTVTLFTTQQTSDFENASRSLTFSLGESGRELCHEISVIDDEVLEDAETYTVSLTSTDNDVAIAVTTASLIILDETDGITVGWLQSRYTVAEEDTELRLCAMIIGLTEIYPSVSFMTTISATRDVGFISTSGELTFTAELRTVCTSIFVADDTIPEPEETFQVQLTSTTISRARLGQSLATVTITDTDRVSVGFVHHEYRVEENINLIEVCVNLSVPITIRIDVTLSVVEDTAQLGIDYSFQQSGQQSYSLTFLPGETSDMCRPVLILEDNRLEDSEIIVLSLETMNLVTDLDPSMSTVIILDNDDVTVGFAEESYTVGEEEQSLSLCVDLTGQTGISLVITISAQDANDFTLEDDRILVFSAVSSQQCFDIEIVPDDFVENDETFSLSIETTNNAVILAPATTLIIIRNDDFTAILFGETEYVISEGENVVTVCLSIGAGILERNVSVSLSTSGISAEEGEDFIQTVMELQFTPTELERCMGVRIRDDTAVEDTEVFLVIVDSSDPVSFTTESVTVSILDDQDNIRDVNFTSIKLGVSVGFQSPSYVAIEGSILSVCVELIGSIQRSLIVSMVVSDGTASGGQDFTPITIPDRVFQNEPVLCVEISFEDDSIHEEQETITFEITTADNAADLGIRTTTVFITDNDDAFPKFTANMHSVNEDVQQVEVCVLVDIQTERSITLSLSTQDGTANAPNDYTSLSEDISFQPATTSQRICTSVTVDDDMVLEAEETFLIILETSDTRVILIAENSRTSVRINDNDDGVIIAGLEESEYEVNESELSLSICAIQLASIERDVGVIFFTESQSATLGLDFTAQTLRPTFSSGLTQQRLCFDISISNDQLLETNEEFKVSLTSVDLNLNFSPNSATVTIINSNFVTVSFRPTNYVFLEDDETGTICAESSGASEIQFTVSFSTSSGTAQGSLDYRSIESTDVTFDVGTNQVCINVMIFNDNILENDEFFTVSLASLSTGVSILTGSSTVEIRDNDEVIVNWERADYPVAEGLVLRLCATALQPTARQFVVDVIAPISEDFSIEDTQLIFSSEEPQTSCTNVTITGDDGLENEEIFSFSLRSSDSDVSIGPTAVTRIRITNADGIMVNLQQSGYIVTEGQTATVCAGVTGDRDIPVTIGVSTTPITAEVTDFGIPNPSQLVFDVDVNSACTGITTDNDGIYEENETFSVSLSSTSDSVDIAVSTATVQITNNDGVVVNWQQTQYSPTEGSVLSVCAVQLEQTEKGFIVDIRALTSQDFSIENTQLTFQPSGVSQTSCTNVATVDDNRLEVDEIFHLTLESSDSEVTIGSPTVTLVSIGDNDDIEVRLREPTYRVTEGQAAVVCADIQSGVSDVAIVLSVSATQDTAQATDDYEDPPSELVIEVGATAECITIATVNNGIYEETEAFLIVLSTTSDSVVITRTSTTVEITDNDDVIVNWSQSQYSTSEGITLMVCVEQAEQADKAFSVDVIAPDSEDLTVVLSQLTFIPDGGHQICTDVMIASNDGLEDEETFHLTLDSSDSDRIIVGPPATTSILITDTDEITVSFQFSRYGVIEGETRTVCASIVSGTSNIAFTLGLSTVQVTTEVDDAFPPSPLQLVFSVGNISACTTIRTQSDTVYEDNEMFTVSLTSTNPSISISVSSAVVEITDNDGVTVNWEQLQYSPSEGGVLSVCALQPEQTEKDFTVTIIAPTSSVSDFSVEGDSQLNFPSGRESQISCVTVTITSDDELEDEETFCLTLESSDSDITIGPTAVTCLVIEDGNNLTISFQELSYNITEGLTVRVCADIISGISATSVIIDVSTAEGTAEGSEYGVPDPSQLVFDVGVNTSCTDITTDNDGIYEENETFSVSLSSTSDSVDVTVSIATVQIIDDDGVVVNWEQTQYSTTEGSVLSVCAVQLEPTEKGFGVVIIRTLSTEDFSIDNSQLTFSPSEEPQTSCTSVTIASDDGLENEETFCLTLDSLVSDVAIGPSAVTCIVVEDTSNVTVGFSMPSYNVQETSEAPEICVSLVGDTAIPIMISFSTTDRTATETADYISPTENIVFIGNGPQENCISITIIDDAVLEDTESFLVLIASNISHGVDVNPSSVVVFIVGAENIFVRLQAVRYIVEEGNSMMVCAELVGRTEVTLEVNITTESSGLAEAGRDYSALSEVLIFEPRDQENSLQCVDFSAMSDNVVEVEETLSVILNDARPQIMILMPSQAIIAILDLTVATFTFTPPSFAASEADDSVSVCASLSDSTQLARSIIVTLEAAEQSAQELQDYMQIDGGQMVEFTNEDTTLCINVTIVDDMILESNEQFIVTAHSSDLSAQVPTTPASVIIQDDDTVNVGLTQGTYAVMESEEEVVMVCARLTGLIARDVNVRLSTTSNTAEEGSDFTSLIGDVRTFLPFLQSDVCWPISITNDSHVEGTEDFLVSLFTDDTGVILNPNMAKVVIVEEDFVTVEFESELYQFSEGEREAEVCVVLIGSIQGTVSVQILIDNTAEQDFTLGAVVVAFELTDVRQCVPLNIVDDSILEYDETFTLSLESQLDSVVISSSNTTVIIENNDPIQVSLESSVYEPNESAGNVVVCATIAGTIARSVAVILVMSPNTAEAERDYISVPENILFEPTGIQEICVTIQIVDDDVLENEEMFLLSFESDDQSIVFAEAAVTITDDDSVIVQFNQTVYSSLEEDEQVILFISVLGQSDITIQLELRKMAQSATSNDYDDEVQILSLQAPSPVNPESAAIVIMNDNIAEVTEIFSVILFSNNDSFIVPIPTSTAEIYIIDTDSVIVGFTSSVYEASEADGETQVCISLSGQTERNVLLTLAAVDGAATDGDDYDVGSFSMELTASEYESLDSVCHNFTLLEDQLLEPDETITFQLNTTDSFINFSQDSAVFTILDSTEPSIVTITSTLMDISTRASNGSKTEENLNIISGTLDNVANVIETENIGINEMTLESVSVAVGYISDNWPPEVLQSNASLIIVNAVERITTVFVKQLSGPSANTFCANGVFFQTKKVVVGQVTDLILISDCVDKVPASRLVSMIIPEGIFSERDSGTEVNIVFMLYNSSRLFPDATKSNIRVKTSVIGASIDTFNTDSLRENVTIFFQLEQTSNFYQCVSYDFSNSQWLGNGCSTTVNQTGVVTCNCDHLTNFAVQLSDSPLVCQQPVQEGDFLCRCDSGYVLRPDGQTCLDINECLDLVLPVCDDKAVCSNTEGSYDCTCIDGYSGSGRPGNCAGIPPDVKILQIPSDGNSIPVTRGPWRSFNLTCVSSGEYVGDVVWTKLDINNMQVEVPTEETQRGALFRENLNFLSESLVAGISGIQRIAEGEYVCTASNANAAASISVLLEVPELRGEDVEGSSFIRFSTERSLESIAQGVGIDPGLLSQVYDYINSVALSSIDPSEPDYQAFDCKRVPAVSLGEMERVECQFSSYISDIALDAGRIELLMNVLLNTGIISPNSSISISDRGFCDEVLTTNEMFGNYLWPETAVGETSLLPCNFSGPNDNPMAMRMCVSRGEWSTNQEYGECHTFITMMYVNFNTEDIKTDNVVKIMKALEELVTMTKALIDQSQNNFDVILNVISTSIRVIREGNFTDTDLGRVVANVALILDDIQIWPEDQIVQSSMSLVELLEDIAIIFVLNDEISDGESVTLLNVTGDTSAIVLERNDTNTLQMVGREVSTSMQNNGTFIVSSTSESVIASIQLPASLFSEDSVVNSVGDGVGLVFAVYERSVLFPLANGSRPTVEIRSSIIGALLGGLPTLGDLPDPIEIHLQIAIGSDELALDATCVSWDFRAAGGVGNWSDRGCTTTLDRESEIVVCLCNHLTNFGALVDVCSRTEGDCQPNGGTETALEVISYIGVTLSIIGLILTIITMLLFKKLRSRDASKFHVQLSLALLGMLLVFVVGIDRTEVFEGCVTVSVLIHYFTLVAVMWMGAEALLMFQKLIIVFVQITARYIIIVSFVCWLAPVIPVVISVSIDPRFMVSYQDVQSTFTNTTTQENLRFCFIGEVGVLFGAFLGPILAILLFNSVIFALVIRVLILHSLKKQHGKKMDKKNAENVKRLLISIFGIMFLFGLTWVFGALTISDASTAFQFLFAIFNSLQGFFIFVFFCVLGKEARELWLQFLCRGRKIPWITSSTTDSQPRSGGATLSTSAVSHARGTRSTSGTQLRSSTGSIFASYLRRPSSTLSVGDGFNSSIEMDPMGSTITNLHVIQEGEEENEISCTQDSAGLELSQSSRHDISRSSARELLNVDYSPSQSGSAVSFEDGTGSSPQIQDTPLSPGSGATSNDSSEIIENPYVEHEDHSD